MRSKTIQVSVYIDPALHKWAEARAQEEDRSLSSWIVHVIRGEKSPPKHAPAPTWSPPPPDTSGLSRQSAPYVAPRPVTPMYPPKAPAVFDPVAAADWYKKGLVRFKGDRTEALAYTRRCVSLLPKEWVPPQDDVGDTADTELDDTESDDESVAH